MIPCRRARPGQIEAMWAMGGMFLVYQQPVCVMCFNVRALQCVMV